MFDDTYPYVLHNGRIVLAEEAKVSIFDRGYLFADGVYEGISVYHRQCIDNQPHLDRLSRSLKEIGIVPAFNQQNIIQWQQQLIAENNLDEGFLYLQITRAIASRDFHYLGGGDAQCVMFMKRNRVIDNPKVEEGVKVCVVNDLRWKRRDIKSIALLPQTIAKQQAVEKGCFEAWMEEDGYITEGSSTSAFIVIDNTIIVRPLSHSILPGVTRAAMLRLAAQRGVAIEERLFTKEEAYKAQEAFITSASNILMPVVVIDGHRVGSGTPGAISKQLRQAYIDTYL